MFARLLAVVLLFIAGVSFAQAPRTYVEGVDYIRLARPMSTATGDRVEVLEAFSYSCVHCAELEPILVQWKTTAPANAQLVRLPIAWPGNLDWEMAARAYFAAEALNVLDKTHQATFNVRFQQRKLLSTAEDYATHYATLGVDQAKFLAAMRSFTVGAKLKRSQKLAPEYGVVETPTVIIDGRYRLKARTLGELPELINFVVGKVAAERGSK